MEVGYGNLKVGYYLAQRYRDSLLGIEYANLSETEYGRLPECDYSPKNLL